MCGGMAILTVKSPSDSPLIGVGIATALLPPLVAAGYALGLGAGRSSEDSEYGTPQQQAGASLSVFVVNAVSIILGLLLLSSICGSCTKTGANERFSQWWLSLAKTKP